MFMEFTSKEELATFLSHKPDYKQYIKQLRSCGDRIFIKNTPMSDQEIDKLMRGRNLTMK